VYVDPSNGRIRLQPPAADLLSAVAASSRTRETVKPFMQTLHTRVGRWTGR